VVIRDFPIGLLPFGALGPLLGIYQTPDLAGYTEYTRLYLATLHEELVAAGRAGAAGVVFTFDVPGKQVRGYYDPHVGTLYRVPAGFVGSAQATRLEALAAQGSFGPVAVRARVARTRTRNLIARLPGKSAEKIVLAANTDGNSWVQEDGVIGMLAFARYYAKLPKRCHPRTLATKRRNLPRTAVLKGLGVPNPGQAPPICSMGGLGNAFHPNLVPTLAMISGPWSLYEPVFGRRVIDFGQMRAQVLAAGDAILALDGLPRARIAGDYPALQAELDEGTKAGCPSPKLPLPAPSPG
jgi:hypothetical protein